MLCSYANVILSDLFCCYEGGLMIPHLIPEVFELSSPAFLYFLSFIKGLIRTLLHQLWVDAQFFISCFEDILGC